MIEFEMVEHFGGLSEYLDAPFWTVRKHEWVWRARNKARATQEKRQQEAIEQREAAY